MKGKGENESASLAWRGNSHRDLTVLKILQLRGDGGRWRCVGEIEEQRARKNEKNAIVVRGIKRRIRQGLRQTGKRGGGGEAEKKGEREREREQVQERRKEARARSRERDRV